MKKKIDPMLYWKTHKCWRCNTHSVDQKQLKMLSLGNGFICINCYKELFGN